MSGLPFDLPDGKPLAKETVVFTGKLWSLGRREARALVTELGGTPEDEVSLRTSLLVVGAGTYPDGVPDDPPLRADTSSHSQKLRRAAQINQETPGPHPRDERGRVLPARRAASGGRAPDSSTTASATS
jgi:hypothetical protein